MTTRAPIQADGPVLSDDAICDLCGNHGLVSQWTTRPFVHDYNVTGQSMPMRYSYPWALCETCDTLVSADDREGLREHVRGTEKTKAMYEDIRAAGIPGALEVTRRHLDALHDDFWAAKLERGPLTDLDPLQVGVGPSFLDNLPDDVRGMYDSFVEMVEAGQINLADRERLLLALAETDTGDEAREMFKTFEQEVLGKYRPMERIDVNLIPDAPGMPGRNGANIEVQSGVSKDGRAFVHILVDGKPRGQMTPNEVRSLAMQWLEAAEAAEHDAALFQWATTTRSDGSNPLDAQGAAVLIGELRQFRGDDHTSTVGK